ncbi:ABC transporter permease [Mesorhizobium sp. RP14(2022)]|uniref:ABC transporter permease n=1 Tax=Mesorhizobium liriopis TaxID=2953882 RepID=A0ABT1C450_9HYPH|nr:ABC transporter permease [Mesorhizobium liriopis]MCO6049616.1 ABC transporter permease [Mesorhizobium liriopis]
MPDALSVAGAVPHASDGRAGLTRLRRRPEFWLLLVILIVGALFSALAPGFLSLPNVIDLLETYSVQAVMAMGLFVVLVAGGIDISFAATASVSQYCAALLASQMGLPAPLVILAGLLIGTALGCLNAALIFYLRITSIIATIAMMSVSFSLLMYFSGGRSIYTLPDWWTTRITFFQTETASGDLARITLPIVLMIVVALVTWAMMTRLSVGRQLYAMGGNAEAARRIGVPIARLHFVAYGYLGFTAALAGMLQAHRVGESVPNAFANTELAVLSAAVLGGASLTGGIGTVPGVLLGIVLLAMLQNGLNLLGVSSYFFQIVIGLTILVSTSVTVISSRRGRRLRGIGEASTHG